MERELKKIKLLIEENNLSSSQALTLLMIKHNMLEVNINEKELLDLVNRGFIKGNKLTVFSHEIIDEVLKRRPNSKLNKNRAAIKSSKPILTKETSEVVIYLGKYFIQNFYSKLEHDKISVYTKSNPIMSPFLFLFFQMFPSKANNDNWVKQFGKYDGVSLRRYTNSTIQKIIGILRRHDLGLFLLGTYLFIQDSYSTSGERYYVKKVENYLKEWDHWYSEAEDLLKSGKLEAMTKRAKKVSHNNTYVI